MIELETHIAKENEEWDGHMPSAFFLVETTIEALTEKEVVYVYRLEEEAVFEVYSQEILDEKKYQELFKKDLILKARGIVAQTIDAIHSEYLRIHMDFCPPRIEADTYLDMKMIHYLEERYSIRKETQAAFIEWVRNSVLNTAKP